MDKSLDLSTAGRLKLKSGTMPLTNYHEAGAGMRAEPDDRVVLRIPGIAAAGAPSAGNHRMYSDADLARARFAPTAPAD